MPTIKLKSSQDDIFIVDIEIANASKTIKDILKSEGVQDDLVVPLDRVNSTVLKQAIEWATHHHEHHVTPPQCNGETGKPPCADHSSWEAAFFDLRLVPTLELLKGALNLQMEGLIDSATKALTALVDSMTPEHVFAEYQATAAPDQAFQAQRNVARRAKRPGPQGGPPGRLGNKKTKKDETKKEEVLSECSDDSTHTD